MIFYFYGSDSEEEDDSILLPKFFSMTMNELPTMEISVVNLPFLGSIEAFPVVEAI